MGLMSWHFGYLWSMSEHSQRCCAGAARNMTHPHARITRHWMFMLLMCAGMACISLVVVAFFLCVCAYTSSLTPAAVPPRIQELDVGLIQHVCLAPACRPVVVSRSACRRSDALQRIFTATAWLCLQWRLRRSSGQQDKPSRSNVHQRIERGFGQRLAVSWQHRLDGSFSGYRLRKVAAHETRVELYRQRLLVETVHGACDLTSQHLRQSLLPRR